MKNRSFLFLQGPHGPFFRQLARNLRRAGASTWKVGFNAGDAALWRPFRNYIPFKTVGIEWPAFFEDILERHNVTDIVYYGEGRPVHDQAAEIARSRGITTHIFEEGYIRPYWITYERDGSNGNSPLRSIPLSAMRSDNESSDAPQNAAGWGELREHIFYGAVYHAALMVGSPFYPNFKSHREVSVARETFLNFARFASIPLHSLQRRAATARIRLSGYPYHLALLQLEHDASFRGHANYNSMADFVREIIDGFKEGARPHHHLIFKAHPLEDGRAKLRSAIKQAAIKAGIANRVHYLRGGKLAGMLDDAISAVTINSTAGQQVLRRGIPLKALGEAVYSGRGFTSAQSLVDFFDDPMSPDLEAYQTFRTYQLQTTQVLGGYYAAAGRARLNRRIVDMMLSDLGPYARQQNVSDRTRHIKLVSED